MKNINPSMPKLLFLLFSSLLAQFFGSFCVASGPEEFYHKVGCSIYDAKYKIVKKFPGNRCVFFENGEYILSDANAGKLIKFDSYGNTVWERSFNVGHGLDYFPNENALIAIHLENSRHLGVFAEYSSLVKFDLAGKILSYTSAVTGFEMFHRTVPNYHLKLRTNLYRREAMFEDTHANAIYRVPANILSQWNPAFQEGNFIVTFGRTYGVAIFDNELEHILWFKEFPSFRYIHDAQVTEDGKIVFYQNAYNKRFNSRIEIFDPVQNTIVWYFPKDNSMIAPSQGGIQIFKDGSLLISDITNKVTSAVEIDRYGAVTGRYILQEHPDDFQDIKRVNLSSFLKNNKQ